MSRRPFRSALTVVGLLFLVLGAVQARAVSAESEAPPVEPRHAERVARDVVDELGLDKAPEDQPDNPRIQPPAGSALGAVGQVLAYLLVGAAGAGLAYAIVALVRGAGRRRSHDDDDTDDEVGVETGVATAAEDIDTLSAQQWRERAAAAEAAGRYADAVRFLHYAGLLGLDEDGLVAFEPGRPNGDYVRVLTRLVPGPAPADLVHLNRLMEDATFGHHDLDPAAVAWSRSGWARIRDAFTAGATA